MLDQWTCVEQPTNDTVAESPLKKLPKAQNSVFKERPFGVLSRYRSYVASGGQKVRGNWPTLRAQPLSGPLSSRAQCPTSRNRPEYSWRWSLARWPLGARRQQPCPRLWSIAEGRRSQEMTGQAMTRISSEPFSMSPFVLLSRCPPDGVAVPLRSYHSQG
jgi:hypothetical protein